MHGPGHARVMWPDRTERVQPFGLGGDEGVSTDGPCWLTVAGFMAAHASLHSMVTACRAVGLGGVRSAVLPPSPAMTCAH